MLNQNFTFIGIIISIVIASVNARVYFVRDDTQTAVREIKKLLGRETTAEDTSIEEYSRNKRIKVTLQPNPNKSEFARKLVNAVKVYYTHLNGDRDQGTQSKICERHFGSLYGTKYQKEKCIQEYLEEQLAVTKESESNNSKYKDETRTVKTKRNIESFKVKNNDGKNIMVMILNRGASPFRKNDFKQDKFALDYYDDTRKSTNTGFVNYIDYENDDKIYKYILRSRTDSDSTATEGSEEESTDENEQDTLKNRFNIVDNFETEKQSKMKPKYIQQYQGSSSVESLEMTPKPKKKNKKQRVQDNEFLYMQGPQRLVQSESDSSYEDSAPQNRKYNDRLPHFMPKRYFWHEDNFDKLGYFWFDGAQGLVPHNGAPS